MKKVLSVAMASAMVLGMGANAFAIQYASGSSDTAAWPAGFQFDGSLFVTDKNGDIVEATLTDLNGKTRVNFNEGDTIWMPLYANNQKVYTVDDYQKGYDKVEATTISLTPVLENVVEGQILVNHLGDVMPFTYADNVNNVIYYYGASEKPATLKEGWRAVEIEKPNFVFTKDGKVVKATDIYTTAKDVVEDAYSDLYVKYDTDSTGKITKVYTYNASGAETEYTAVGVLPHTGDYYTAGVSTAPETAKKFTDGEIKDMIYTQEGTTLAPSKTKETVVLKDVLVGTNENDKVVVASGVKVQVSLPEVAAVKENLGTTVGVNGEETTQDFVNTVAYGHYTGNIDKNWSINLIEEDNGVADLIDHAELYKADEVDYLSYKDYTTEIMPNAVYLKVELKDTWKLAKAADLKYYVYVADNKSGKETNKVWVSGKYEASNVQTVDFTWTNDASQPAVWKVAKNENGIAVFDFADKAFFQVKMYAEESMYLDLSTAYDAAMAGDFDEADQFFAFDNENANFSRTGTLILVSDDASLVPYQVTEDGYTKVDAEYVEDFVIAHTNEKVDGFVFETKELGNYVLATDELEVEEDDKDDTQEVVVPDTDNNTTNNSKPNPSTGAEDFVGLAVSLAVVSVAAAGALALKK